MVSKRTDSQSTPPAEHDERPGDDVVAGGDRDSSTPPTPSNPRARGKGRSADGKSKAKPKTKKEDTPFGGASAEEIAGRLAEKSGRIQEMTEEIERLKEEYKLLEDKRLRLAAEYDNFRKRTRREWELLGHQAKAEVIVETLGVVDDLERALAATGESADDFVKGVRLIYQNLMAVLERFGVTKMEARGEAFDPGRHMAVAQVESDEVASGEIADVVQAGYVMNDSVIRPARVVIAK